MTATLGDHPLAWTEQEYLALGETAERIELFDGGLQVTPAPTFRHQDISYALAAAPTRRSGRSKPRRSPWRRRSNQSPGLRASESGRRSTCGFTPAGYLFLILWSRGTWILAAA